MINSRLDLSTLPGSCRRAARSSASRLAAALVVIGCLIGATSGLAVLSGDAAAQSTAADDAAAGSAPSETPSPADSPQASPAEPVETPPATPPRPAVEPGPDLSPYAVLVRLNVPLDAQVSAQFRDRLRDEFAAALRAALGQMWTTTIDLVDDSRAASASALARLDGTELTDEFAESSFDKVFLVGVSLQGSCWSLVTREWDAASRTIGAVFDQSTCDARLAALLTADVVMRAFRPVARIEDVEGDIIVTSIRAGEFPAAEPERAQFTTGDLLTPFVRYYDRDRNLQQIRDLPWTYLRVSSVTRARMECESISAYRTPLSGSRRRMELMAIKARPTFPASRVIIAPRGDASDPLPGCRVEVLNRAPTADDPVDDRQKLLTDRRGAIVVNVDGDHPLQHVLVYSGKALLARVPLIPGLEESVTLAIPDDAARLSVEGALSVLEGELIDAVARRSMLMARARRASKARKWEDVARFVEQLQTVPDYEAFRQLVATVQLPAVQSARELGDRVAEARIKKMCSDLQQSASGHLDAEKIREFRIEMDELRRATQ